jgi:hypothetical protein
MLPVGSHVLKTTYGLLIDTALYVMLLMKANPLLGQVGVESLLICVFFLAPRDQPVQWNKPATHRPAGYPQAAGYPPTSRLPLYIIL